MHVRQRLRTLAAPALVFAVLGMLVVWPAATVVSGAFRPSAGPGGWTLESFASTFSDPSTLLAILNSTVLAVVATVLGLLIAAALAFLVARTDVPLRGLITPAMVCMFATPPLFFATGYSLLANQYTGLLSSAYRAITGLADSPFNIESWSGLILVTTFRAVAFMYLFIIGPFHAFDSSYEEASLTSGQSGLKTFFLINLPILAPALTGTAILGLMAGLQTFDTALIIGRPAQIEVISTRILDYVIHSSPPLYGRASALSTMLLAIVGLLCMAQARMLGGRNFVTISGKSKAQRRQSLGAWKLPVAAAIVLYLLVAEVAPIVSLILSSFQPYPGVYANFSFSNYLSVFARPGTLQAITTTCVLMIVVGVAAMTLAVVITHVAEAMKGATSAVLKFILLIPYAMVGIIVALAVARSYLSVPGLRQIYGTIWLLIVALIVVVMPFAMNAAQAAVSQIGKDLCEAARTCGSNSLGMVRHVTIPLILPSFVAGWYVVSTMVAGNLDVPLVLGAANLSTVASLVYGLFSEARLGEAAALLVLLMAAMVAIGIAGYCMLRAWLAYRRWRDAARHRQSNHGFTITKARA